jgi:hypothetical protein
VRALQHGLTCCSAAPSAAVKAAPARPRAPAGSTRPSDSATARAGCSW